MSKRFMQGLWLGIILMLWGIVAWTHGSLSIVVFHECALTIGGGALAATAEIEIDS